MSLAAHRAVHCVGLSAFPSLACRWPGLAPAGDLLSCFAKKVSKEGDPASPVGLRPTPLRCSQQAAGAELAGVAGSDSSPGRPRLLLRCSADQTGFLESPSLCGSHCSNSTRRQLAFECMDNTSRFRRGSVAVKGPFHTAEQRSGRRRSPARLSEPAQPASSAPAACCEQRRGVGRDSGRPVWPGRLSCLLLWRRKEVGRPRGRDPANETLITGKRLNDCASVRSRVTP